MKKSLLFASAILVAASASAIVRDGDTYEEFTIGDKTYTLTNRWMTSLNYDAEKFAASPLSKDNGGANYRTACISGDYILVSGSPLRATGEVDDKGAAISTNIGVIEVYNLADGSFVKELTLTKEDGTLLSGTLCANQIGCDDAGNVWLAGAMFNANASDFQFYLVDIETGKLTALPPISPLNYGIIPETIGEDGTKARMDYYDVRGDITGATGPAFVMGAFNDSAAALSLLRAVRDEGGEEFYGANTDDLFYNDPASIKETYPMITNAETGEKKPQATWGTAPLVRMIDDGSGEFSQFYVDGFTTAPSIYDVSMAFIDGFANNVDLTPMVGSNGIAEFNLSGNNFVVYSLQQYDKEPGCQSRIACFGEGFSYADLQTCWNFPAGGLGMLSDGGTRMHNLVTKKFIDGSGKEAAYILNFKCCNGLAVYVVAEKDFVDPNPVPEYPEIGGVDAVESDVNAPAEYFNLQGVRVANPQNGLYIVRQGSKVSKQVIR